MTSDPAKPLCVFERNGVKCGKTPEHFYHPNNHPYTPPAETGRCGNEWPMKHGYFCQLPKGHSGDHESECPNPAFHQSWPDTPPAETKAGPSWTGDDWDRIDATTGLPEPAAPVSPPQCHGCIQRDEEIMTLRQAIDSAIEIIPASMGGHVTLGLNILQKARRRI